MKQDHQEIRDEDLDSAGRAVLRAAPASDEEIQRVLSSPFLYPKIRARMRSEKTPPVPFYHSLMMVSLLRRAIPILAL